MMNHHDDNDEEEYEVGDQAQLLQIMMANLPTQEEPPPDPRLKCPVCNYPHDEVDLSQSSSSKFQPQIQHLCSHGASMIFTKADCPVCMEDQIGPPVVTLPCGHILCVQDFQRLGGRTGQYANQIPEPPQQTQLQPQPDGAEQFEEQYAEQIQQLFQEFQIDDRQPEQFEEQIQLLFQEFLDDRQRVLSFDSYLMSTIGYEDDEDNEEDDSLQGMPPLIIHQNEQVRGQHPHAFVANNDSFSEEEEESSIPPWIALLKDDLINGNDIPLGPDSDSDDDDGPPPLLARRNDSDTTSGDGDDDDDDDDSLPPLLPRQYDSEGTTTSSDEEEEVNGSPPSRITTLPLANDEDDEDDDSLPPLLPRKNDDDDSVPPLLPRQNDDSFMSSSSSDDESMPPLLGRRGDNNDSSDDSSHDSRQEQRQEEAAARQRRETAEERQRQEQRRKEEKRKRKGAEKRRKQKARRKIFQFAQKHFYRKQAQRWLETCRVGFGKLQATYRGVQIRQVWGERLRNRLELARRYHENWNASMEQLWAVENRELNSWSSLLESLEFIVPEDEDEAVNQILDEATEKALDSEEQLVDDLEDDELLPPSEPSEPEATPVAAAAPPMAPKDAFTGTHTNIMYTDTVKKWLKTHAGGKYRGLFVKRINQLSRGERSRILAKRLKGGKNTIYETYLEQKSGKRILWTIEGNDLLVWYVANHDNVSRLMRLIDDSQSRSQRQLVSASYLIEDESDAAKTENNEQQIILNPFGNTPMKVYEVSLNDIGEVAGGSWVPRLKLTEEERDVVQTKGTVLLLGRSGTGKTICTANRMDYDRQLMAHDPSFSQLFVARSKSLCTYVKNATGSNDNDSFTTYDELKEQLEGNLPKVAGVRDGFPEELEMRYYRFKREVYSGEESLDPLLVWTSIRSFIKGSIEATLNKPSHALSRDDFLDFEKFGSKRCRLTREQRQVAYRIYKRYVKFMHDKEMWDECDRILALLTRLEDCKTSDPDLYQRVKKSKVYVDEVQDYTQAECLLFFYLSDGQGNLFLAGDPAQNVEEGVEFRFEDIRSVEYHIAKDRNTVMEKPKIVNVNFRSHAGILNTAGAILSCMFGAFPNSAKQLKEDHGIFVGPRPGVFEKVEINVLKDLLIKKLDGTVVLVHGSCLNYWKETLPEYGLIRSIEASKGLEFKSVILLDFFTELSQQTDIEVQKAWRDLLIRGAGDDFDKKFPEIEGHLKRLYTGVTRCIEQLFFVETKETVAGNAFVRWLTTTSTARNKKSREDGSEKGKLATKNKVVDVENQVMTKDEALKSGMQMAAAAEARGRNDPSASKEDMDQAIYYFELADDMRYEKKAKVHQESIGLKSNLPPMPSRSEQKDETLNHEFKDIEAEAARIVEKLVKEGLLLEARDLCMCMLPYLSNLTQERLRANLISELG